MEDNFPKQRPLESAKKLISFSEVHSDIRLRFNDGLVAVSGVGFSGVSRSTMSSVRGLISGVSDVLTAFRC